MRKTRIGLLTIGVLGLALSSSPMIALAASTNGSSSLTEAQLRVCQNRQAAINRITARIVTRGENQLTLFSTIAHRVEAFAKTKNVSASVYEQQVATLEADKTKATDDLTAMKTTQTLDCTGSDPKGTASAFQANLKQEISDLKTYRTDIKNLIVAVKTALGTSNNAGGNQ